MVAYEASQRRVNAPAAYQPYGRARRLDAFTAERTWTGYDLLGFLGALPWPRVPRVVVLDGASLHTGEVVRAARPGRTTAKPTVKLAMLRAAWAQSNVRLIPVIRAA